MGEKATSFFSSSLASPSNNFLSLKEAQSLKVNRESLGKISRLEKLKYDYDASALKYNNAQAKTAEANRQIDIYKKQIEKTERELSTTKIDLGKLENLINLVNSDTEKDVLIREQNSLNKKIKKSQKHLKGLRDKLANAVKDALEAEKQLGKSYQAFQKAESKFLPFADTLEKEKQKIAAEEEAIVKAINEAKKREKLEKIEEIEQAKRIHAATLKAKNRKMASKKLERQLSLMKKERIKQARKEGRELSPVELEQWEAKERELRKQFIDEQYEIYDESDQISEFDTRVEKFAKIKYERATEEFKRAQDQLQALNSEKDFHVEAIQELEKKEKKAKDSHSMKLQLAKASKGTARESFALNDVKSAETEYQEIVSHLNQQRKLKNEVIKKLIDAQEKFEQKQSNLDKAKQLYEEISRKIAAKEENLAKKEKGKEEFLIPGLAGPEGISYQGSWPLGFVEKKVSARADKPVGNQYDINAIVLTGDRDEVINLKNWQDYENDALYAPMSDADIENFRQQLLKDLQEDGYVFATVSVYKHSLKLGFLKFRVHVGEKGKVTVVGNRWNSAEQILEATSWKTGEHFNYRELYNNIFDINTKPDVRINTRLIPNVDEHGKRTVDVELNVIDRLPIHGSFNLSNTGVDETGDFRLRTTLQHGNLTHRNDSLSIQWLTDPQELQDINSFSGSYNLSLGDYSNLTLYGGWSKSDIFDYFFRLRNRCFWTWILCRRSLFQVPYFQTEI